MEQYDVIVIGAGIAGTLISYKLAQKKMKVLLLEAGADRSIERTKMTLDYAGAINKNPSSPYRNSQDYFKAPEDENGFNYVAANPKDKFKSTYLKMAGGTTWHWLGNVPRFLPNDFRMKELYGVGENWLVMYDEIEPWYCIAENEIGVSGNHEEWSTYVPSFRSKPFPMKQIWQAYSDLYIKEKIDDSEYDGFKIHVLSTPQARNSQPYDGRPACAGNSICVPICPIQAKYDGTVHLKKAIEAHVEVKFKTIASKLEVNDAGLVQKVITRNWDKTEETFESKIVVIAAHAIESAMLLLRSNISNSSGQVGKNLMDHLQGYGVALSKEPLYPFRGPPTTSGIDIFRDGKFRNTHAAFRISLGNDGWGRAKDLSAVLNDFINDKDFYIGKTLRDKVEYIITRQFRFSFSTEMLPDENNYVILDDKIDPISGLQEPKLNFVVNEYNKKAFDYAWKVFDFMFEKIGMEYKPFTSLQYRDREKYSGAGHIMGTTRMGNDKRISVVDRNCRSHENRNLFVVGPSVFPTCGTANPTLTAAALALRTADHIVKEFESNMS